MATERVDKGWAQKGIETYGNEAILGTLAHYGITIDEAGFKALSEQFFPLGMAVEWHERWKGTGQFSRFPAAAAEELWRRWLPEQLAPTDLGLALINLIKTLVDRMEGKPDDGTLETRFKVVEAYLGRIPEPVERRDRFLGELFSALHEWHEAFNGLGEALVKKKLDAFADRFVAIEERLVPERLGIAQAVLKAERGDHEGAVRDVIAISSDAGRDVWNRLSAVDALFDVSESVAAKQALLPIFAEAERSTDVELISAVVERLAHLLELDPQLPERAELRARVEAIAQRLGPGEAP